MPKIIEEKVGTIVRRRKVKTFGDKLKEWIANGVGIAVFLWLLSHAFG